MEEHESGACGQIAGILARVGDKWTVLVIGALADGPLRFNELKRTVGGVSQRMLTLTLRGLERDGLATRTAYPTSPPKVDYALTDLGHTLIEPLQAVVDWVIANQHVVETSQASFDATLRAQAESSARSPVSGV
jgi:DNA-binding HxlR family transcriptional regulator